MSRLARACYLALEPDPALVFLHLPDPAVRRSTAVLLCPPFGWEEMCSYRGRRTWAKTLAGAGYPAARLSLPGEGDSGGSPRDPGRLDAWTKALSTAAGWLREATEAERVVVAGVGLGGMLACRALAEGAPIDDLILWAVPSRGRVVLRELRAYAGVVAARYPEESEPDSLPEGYLSLTGFVMTAETASAIEGVRLAELDLPTARRRVLMIGRDGLSADKQLRERFEQAGALVTVRETSDYGPMMAHPQESRTPRETIATSLEWLSEGPGAEGPEQDGRPSSTAHLAIPEPPAIERQSIEFSQHGALLRETPVWLEAEGGDLFGVLTENTEVEPGSVCAVWLNGGALRHIGPNRTWVEVARRWAAQGVPTLRVDLNGIGDSDGADEQPLPNRSLYASQRTEQTLAILDQLAARGLPNRFVLGGLCSGAYWSVHAALADERVVGALMINLYAFFWSEELVAERETQESLEALRGHGWRRLIRRDVSYDKLKDVMRSMLPGRIRAGAGHPVERAQSERVEMVLDRLRDQGTQGLLLLANGEPLYDQLARQGVLERLDQWPNLVVERIPSRDHMFRAMSLQRHVHESLDRMLERVLKSVPARQQLPQR